MEVDEALKELKTFGRWQLLQFTLLGCATMIPTSLQMVAIVYIGHTPQHRCKISENATLNESIPYDGNKYSSCEMFVNYSQGNETMDCNNGWEYLGDDGPTIVTKWNLVCSKEVLPQTSQMMLVLGIMFGSTLFTALSDRFGRKPVFMSSQLLLIVVGVVTAFNDNLYAFFFLRFLAGAFLQGMLLPGFIWVCELFPSSNRAFVGIMVEEFWSLSTALYPFVACLINNWVHLQLFISLIGLLTLPLFKILPESVIWLCANGRTEEAEMIITKALKFNKIKTTEDIRLFKSSTSCLRSNKCFSWKKTKSTINDENEAKTSHYTISDFFRIRRLGVYLTISSVFWVVSILIYYGLTLSTTQLGGNRYLNAFFIAIVEFPANLVAYFLTRRFGRKKSLTILWLVTGTPLLITPFIPKQTASGSSLFALFIFLTVLGKFGITSVFNTVVLYASEFFPTNLRGQALGISTFFGRVGNIIAAFSSYIMVKNSQILGIVFGILAVTSVLLVYFLPETHNRPLPETVEDIEAWFVKPKNSQQIKEDVEIERL